MKNFLPLAACIVMAFSANIQAQNVGIGTASPASKLTVNGNLAIGAGYLSNDAPTNGAIIQGNLGLGIVLPLAKLHVVGDVMMGSATNPYPSTPGGSASLTLAGTSNTARFTMNDASSNFNLYVNSYYDNASSNHKYINTAAANRIAMNAGTMAFYTAASGTTNTAITWNQPLTLSPNGQVDLTSTSSTVTNIGASASEVVIGSASNDVKVPSLTGTGLRPVYSDNNGVLVNSTGITGSTISPATVITNNSCTAATSTITLADFPTSVNAAIMSVTVNITHPSVGDLRMFLISPSGTVLNLVSTAQTGANFTTLVFSDAGATVFPTSGTAPYSSTFKPAGNTGTTWCSNLGTISTFAGFGAAMNPNGTWTLRVFDQANGNTSNGTINSWSINFASLYSLGSVSITQSASATSTATYNVAGLVNFSTSDLGSITVTTAGTYLVSLNAGMTASNGDKFSVVLCKRTPPTAASAANQIATSIIKSGINASNQTSVSTQCFITLEVGDIISWRGGQTDGDTITGTNWIMTILKIG